MRRLLFSVLLLAMLPVWGWSQTVFISEGFETNGEGTSYRSNTFDDGFDDVWARFALDTFPSGPNSNFSAAYSGQVGSYVFGGEDTQTNDNPLGSSSSAYLTLETVDVSAFAGGIAQVTIYLAAREVGGYEAGDFFKLNYAFDSDISSGANSVGGLPVMDSLETGTYTTAAAYYGASGGAQLIQDTDLDGTPDAGSDSLDLTLTQKTFTFSIPSGVTNMSVQIEVNVDAGSEELVLDEIEVSGTNSIIPVTASILSFNNLSCNGANDGQVVAQATNGSMSLDFIWSSGDSTIGTTSTTDTIFGLAAGTYIVTITDTAGNTDTASVTLTEPSALGLTNTSATDPSSSGGNDGAAAFTASGGTAPYSFSWSNGVVQSPGAQVAFQSFEGTANDDWNFVVNPTTYNDEGDSIVDGSNDVWAIIQEFTGDIDTASNGLYFWGGQDLNNSNGGGNFYHTLTFDAQALDTALAHTLTFDVYTDGYDSADSLNYQVKFDNGTNWDSSGIELNNNSQAWETTTIDIPSGTDFVRLRLQARQDGSSDFVGFDNIKLSAAASVLDTLTAGTYTVTVTDANGCTDSASVTLSDPIPCMFSVSAINDGNVSCNGLSDGGATAFAAGGSGPFSYVWSNGDTTASITGLAAGTYTVTATDAANCVETGSVTITQPDVLVVTGVLDSNVSCAGFGNGGATASVTGGTTAYSYVWSNGATTASITGVNGGTYSVSVTDANGCTDSTSVFIDEPTALVAAAVVDSNATCSGLSDGGATASAAGGTGAYTYLWNNSATTASITGVMGGTYMVTITDANGCTDSASVTIDAPLAVVATTVMDSGAACNGVPDGGATANATGGAMPYSYLWSNGATTASIDSIFSGTYTITITDANGCTDASTVVVIDSAILGATIALDSNVACTGEATGGATASASIGTAPFTYVWSSGATTAAITGVVAGTYTVTITSAEGCTDSFSIVIGQPSTALDVSVTLDSNASCFGFINGGATANATGGTTAYTYAWSNSQNNPALIGVGAGTYTVTVTDANGCTDSASVAVNEPSALNLVLSVDSNASCAGFADGGASVVASGGTAGYTYSWSNSATTASITGVLAGTYTVTVTDASGCTDSTSIPISQSPAILPGLVVDSNASCNGFSDGGVTALSSGGVGPYTYAWNNSATTASITGVMSGTYTVTVTDAIGCTDSASIFVSEPTALTASATPNSLVSCFGLADGSATASGAGGTMPYTYSWSNGGTDATDTTLTANIFTVTITDANGCTADAQVTIGQPAQLVASAMMDELVSCFGGSDGVATASAMGGTMPYSYSWSNGANTATDSTFTANIFTVTVSDANGCTADAQVTLGQPSMLVVGASVDSNVVCNGDDNGGATAFATGGTGPYSYLWATSDTTTSITNVSAGLYGVTVTDANGCTDRDTAVVMEPSPIILSFIVTNATCENGDDGSIAVTPSGGNGGFTYNWSNGQTSDMITNLAPGTYDVTATDQAGCVVVTSEMVGFDNPVPVFTFPADTVFIASEFNTLSAPGSWATYQWSTGSTDSTITINMGGTYSVTVTDTNGCSASDSAEVVLTTGIETLRGGLSVAVYPNPTRGEVILEVEADQFQFTVTDAVGRVVNTGQVMGQRTSIDLAGQRAGMYFVRLQTGDAVTVRRVMLK